MTQQHPLTDELMATNNLKEFRTAPAWRGALANPEVPDHYEILAEFPHVCWGWELDEHQWILRDPLSGEVFLGGTAHGLFTSSNSIDGLKEYINKLTEYVECAQRALEMLTPTNTTQEGLCL